MRTMAIAVPIVFFLAAPALAEPSTAERRAAIEAVMRKMEAATIAADAKAYVALLDPTDDVFFTEQSNLAKDWSRIKPESFALSIVDKKELPGKAVPEAPAEKAPADKAPADKTPEADKPAPAGDAPAAPKKPARPDRSWVDVGSPIEPLFDESRAEFRMQMTWKMTGWEKTRTLTMPVVFTRDAKSGAWRFAGEKWEGVTAPAAGQFNGVRVLFEPGNKKHKEIADAIVAGMPEVRSTVDTHFKMHTPGEVTIKLYQSMQHLQASIWLSYTDSLGGWNEPKESMKILAGGRSGYDAMKKTIAHEYGHCVTFHMGPKATDAPWWVLEGAADFSAAPYRSNAAARRDRTVTNWAKKNELADWDKIEKFPIPEEFKHFMANVYTQGEHMMAFIDSRYGAEGRIAFLRSLFSGKTTDQASREALGVPFTDVDAAWRLAIRQQIGTEPKDDK
jgi:hypothetical protein